MMTSTGVFQDVIDPSVRALFSVASEDQASELYYGSFGLTDYEPDVPGEVLSDLSGPTKAGLAGEGQEYTVVTKVRGLTLAHFKSFLIGLKALTMGNKAEAMA
jgi:hypothetical protein